jgi:hypothetical protein
MMGTTNIPQEIISRCQCGGLQVSIRPNPSAPADSPAHSAVDCHCRPCRKYHSSAFTSYLVVPKDQVVVEGNSAQTYRDICFELGIVERIFCNQCYSKMLTRPKAGATLMDQTLVNLGPLLDDSVPNNYLDSWRTSRRIWQQSSETSWTRAKPQAPSNDDDEDTTTAPRDGRLTGGCSCGASRFYIDYSPPTELQHCYCRLCRQLSGGPYMTWAPFDNIDLAWNTEPPLVRTTPHGQRHICTTCGGALSIVYDDQPNFTWPSAGSLDDNSSGSTLPATTAEMNHHLYRVCHICCNYLQKWYSIPEDGLERIGEAS